MIPIERSQALEEMLDALQPYPRGRREVVIANECTWCLSPALSFRDAISHREYAISGFCQSCQDKVFEGESDER